MAPAVGSIRPDAPGESPASPATPVERPSRSSGASEALGGSRPWAKQLRSTPASHETSGRRWAGGRRVGTAGAGGKFQVGWPLRRESTGNHEKTNVVFRETTTNLRNTEDQKDTLNGGGVLENALAGI